MYGADAWPFTIILNRELAENFGALLAATWIVAPVCGLRPTRALRATRLNLPSPGYATSPPAFTVDCTTSRKLSSTRSVSAAVLPDIFATTETSSDLVNFASNGRLLNGAQRAVTTPIATLTPSNPSRRLYSMHKFPRDCYTFWSIAETYSQLRRLADRASVRLNAVHRGVM